MESTQHVSLSESNDTVLPLVEMLPNRHCYDSCGGSYDLSAEYSLVDLCHVHARIHHILWLSPPSTEQGRYELLRLLDMFKERIVHAALQEVRRNGIVPPSFQPTLSNSPLGSPNDPSNQNLAMGSPEADGPTFLSGVSQ